MASWGREVIGQWVNDFTYTASDGREFVVNTEHVRGEGTYHWAMEWVPPDAGRSYGIWRSIPSLDGSSRKQTVKRRIERYARETS